MFSSKNYVFSQQGLIIPITLQKPKHRNTWCGVKSLLTWKLMQSRKNWNPFPIQVTKTHCWGFNLSSHSTPSQPATHSWLPIFCQKCYPQIKIIMEKAWPSTTLVVRKETTVTTNTEKIQDVVDRNILESFLVPSLLTYMNGTASLPTWQVG